MTKLKTLETSLVLTTAFVVLYYFTSTNTFLYLAIVLGLMGIFIKPLAKYIAIAWFKLADVLNFFVSKIVLGTLFFLILFPIALLYRISNKDNLQLKRTNKSLWVERNLTYSASHLKNIW
jgi:hypothetical protein